MKKYLASLATVAMFVGCGSTGSSGGMSKELSVKIKVDKTELAEGQSVTFDSNVTHAVGAVVYTWLENNDTLGTGNSLTKSDFSVGNHTVVLKVENSGMSATDSKTITVSKFLVGLKAIKGKYNKDYGIDENITFDANVSGTLATTATYKWLKDGTIVPDANSSQLIVTDFNASKHSVMVSVLVEAIEKNASVDFNVSDFSDLNVTTVSNDDVIIQTTATNKLMWVSDDNKSKEACLAVHSGNQFEINASQTFCQTLNSKSFAGANSGWRKPTVAEVSGFITKTIDANILPVYYAPCKILIGTDSSDGVDKAVITRYGKKKNFGAAGSTLGTVSSALTTKNIGLRCVRELP